MAPRVIYESKTIGYLDKLTDQEIRDRLVFLFNTKETIRAEEEYLEEVLQNRKRWAGREMPEDMPETLDLAENDMRFPSRAKMTKATICTCRELGKRCPSCEEWDNWTDIRRVPR